jgi:hypothetical protein
MLRACGASSLSAPGRSWTLPPGTSPAVGIGTTGRESYLTLLAFHEREAEMESIVRVASFLAMLFFIVRWLQAAEVR